MARHSIGEKRQELRKTAVSLAVYCALLGGIGYGVVTAARHPDLIAWLEVERVRGLLQPGPAATAEAPRAPLAPELRGAFAN